MQEILDKIRLSVQERDKDQVLPLVKEAIAAGVAPKDIINHGLIAAMDVVGRQFGEGEIFVPEMLVSAMLMKQGLEMVKPLLKSGEEQSLGLVLMGTVKGDLHDIGKNIVVMMLEGAGFKVMDLGVDLSVQQVVAKVSELKPQILGLSALLTTTMPEMKNVIDTLKENGLRDTVKVMVGGAPVDQKFADLIGADGYAKDAAEAVTLAKKIVAA